MDLQLNEKTALVTGSTAGIGYAIADALAAEGAAVVVNGRTQARVDDAIKSIQVKHKNAQVSGIAADLGTREGAAQLVRRLPDVDILVNNLGTFEPKSFVEITDEEWQNIFEVNVLSGVRLSRQYLPVMLKRNWGRIVFISSESAVNIPTEMIHYGVTKTAQIALARGLAETAAGQVLSSGPVHVAHGNIGFEKYISTDPKGSFGWPIHPKGFAAPELLDLARLQAWTLKPARFK
jgi:NAD(P)-dependent dehydrogenase (short-subunit alcohol dehydrogenase family)